MALIFILVPLELFDFSDIDYFYIDDKISEWIHRAALKDVREISIEGTHFSFVEVPKSIFKFFSLRSLTLKEFRLTNVPDRFGGFAGLTTLYFYKIELEDKTIELMLKLCPVLKILILSNCYGLKRLKIWF
ncbi:hypothetical protein SUGI_0346840 [Cryptomeria japonica]|nr:hypothetical protein SUGI_0346840 [Cryptomeria japonica]